ncbi:MAG: alpha/beta fold hydrolase [Asgard group archaeon]|nr:alpha/beta fold hydrolase [Asgard group archaeon]
MKVEIILKKQSQKKSLDSRNIFSPYNEMLNWLNTFTFNFLKKNESSFLSTISLTEYIIALLDSFTPEEVDQTVKEKAGPFFNQGKEVGIILVHGFSSSAQEMQELGDFLHEKTGYSTYSVLLKGHGTSPADLAQTDLIDWYKSVRDAYKSMRETSEKIVLIGHSMGGTLCLLLAANEEIDVVVSICTPIKVEYFMQDYLFLISDLISYFPRRKEELEIMEKHKLIKYKVSSLKGVQNLLDLMEIAREEITKVKAPILTITAGKDKRVPLYNANKINELVQSEIKKDLFYPDAHHTILFTSDKELVFKEILDFINSVINKKDKKNKK